MCQSYESFRTLHWHWNEYRFEHNYTKKKELQNKWNNFRNIKKLYENQEEPKYTGLVYQIETTFSSLKM